MTSGPPRDVLAFLRRECGLCRFCASCLIADRDRTMPPLSIDRCQRQRAPSSSDVGDEDGGENDDEDAAAAIDYDDNDDDDEGWCTVCFGASSPRYLRELAVPAIRESLLPYCCRPDDETRPRRAGDDALLVRPDEGNFLARDSPTVNLPWLVAVRAHCAIAAARNYLKREAVPSATAWARLRTAEEVHARIKGRLRSSLRGVVEGRLTASEDGDDDGDDGGGEDSSRKVTLSEEMHEEEAGYLGMHVLVLPPSPSIPSNHDGSNEEVMAQMQMIPPSFREHLRRNRGKILQGYHRILNPRKRFRGNE